ncbi:MAG: TonB-dependent receptor [Bacteroidales bacterium]
MEKQSQAACCGVNFRRWSRKSYAAFSSIGKTIRIGVLGLCCSLLALPGHTKESRDTLFIPATPEVQDLEEVVVSAQLTPVVQSELMRIVQVITRAEIEQAPAGDLASLLQSVRGADIRKRGAFGMQADVGIRGGSFDQTMILLNGINITDPQTGHHNLNVPVDLQSIERIEVLQGAGARMFGPNAFSGAINVITRTPGSQPGEVTAEAGQHGLMGGSLTTGLTAGRTSHFLSIHGMKSEGFTRNTDFGAGNLYYRGAYDGAGFTVNLQGAFSQKAFGANSFYTPRFPDQFEEIQTGLFSLSLVPKGKLKIHSSVYWRRHHDRFELFRDEAPAWYNDHNYHLSDVAGANIQWSHPWKLGKSSLAMNYRYEHIYSTVLGHEMNEPRKAGSYQDVYYTRSYQRQGLSIMAEHSVYIGTVSLSAGTLAWLSPELGKGFSLFPGVDAAWQFHPDVRLFASASRTLRLPTFTDLFYNGPTNAGNPDLVPEKALSAEAGLKASHGTLHWEVALFRRWGKDMIDWIRSPGQEQWQSMNLTKVNFTGLEAGISMPLANIYEVQGKPAMVSVHYSHMFANKSSGDFQSHYVMDFLNHKADLRLEVPITPRSGTTWNVSYIDRQGQYMLYEDGGFSHLVSFRPWWSVDARVFYRFRAIELFAEANNLLDQQTVSLANVPQPGRWVKAGAAFTFGK